MMDKIWGSFATASITHRVKANRPLKGNEFVVAFNRCVRKRNSLNWSGLNHVVKNLCLAAPSVTQNGNAMLFEVSRMHRESEYDRGTGCGKTARPGLWRGRPVTGVPTP